LLIFESDLSFRTISYKKTSLQITQEAISSLQHLVHLAQGFLRTLFLMILPDSTAVNETSPFTIIEKRLFDFSKSLFYCYFFSLFEQALPQPEQDTSPPQPPPLCPFIIFQSRHPI